MSKDISPELARKEPFSFENPHDREIYSGLKNLVGDAVASFYRDACKIYYGQYDLEARTHLVGHLLREIFGSLTELVLPYNFREKSGEDTYRQKIQSIIKEYKIDKNQEVINFWLEVAKKGSDFSLAKWTHRSGLLSVRSADDIFDDLWQKSQLLLKFLIDLVESHFNRYVGYLDKLLAQDTISAKDLKELKEKIPCNFVSLGYFFERLNDPECLASLNQEGFFDNPTPPLEHPDGGVSYPNWPQMSYLIKISKNKSIQEKLVEICLNLNTDNPRVHAEVLEIALNLPGKLANKLVEKSYDNWDQINSWLHPEKYGELIVHLAREELKKEALALARKVLAVKPNPREPIEIEGHPITHDPVALFDDFHYEDILTKNYPEFVKVVGLEAIEILLDEIENFIKLKSSRNQSDLKEDYSYIWRKAIEENTQNHNHGIRDLLISAARDACELYIKDNPNQAGYLIEKIDNKKYTIFHRLALHIARVSSDSAKEQVVALLLNEDEFRKGERLVHEYFLLAESCGSMLDQEQRNQIWAWIMNDADIHNFIEWKKQLGQEVTEEVKEKYKRNWQMYHLLPYKNIDPAWTVYYEELEKELGKPEHPSFSSWSSGGSWGPISGLSQEDMGKMEPKEVVKFMKVWKPPKNDPLDRSREGTGRQLSEDVKSRPNEWTSEVASFKELDPTYVRSLLGGYRDALRQEKKFNWEPILNLCKSVLKKPIKIKGRKKSTPFGDDPDWSWCRNTILDLMDEGLRDSTGKLPMKYRKDAWLIIEELTKDKDPTPEREKEYLGESQDDPLTLAINSTRGDAIAAAIQYGIWLKNNTTLKKEEVWSLKKHAPELLEVLNDHLNTTKDPSLAIRAVYGQRLGALAWLDKDWVKSEKDVIFPKRSEEVDYFNASWEAYIEFVNPYKDLLEILKDKYKKALVEIGNRTNSKHHLENPDQRLVQHLMVFYWAGDLPLDDELLTLFYRKAPTELKNTAITFIGRNLKKTEKVPNDALKRLEKLWEYRFKAIIELVDQGNHEAGKEASGFSWWFVSKHFDEKWLLEQMTIILNHGVEIEGDHLVIDKLLQLASIFPLEVISIALLLVDQDKKGWGVLTLKDDLKTVIKLILETKEKEAHTIARNLINKLIAKNHLDFRDLLEKAN